MSITFGGLATGMDTNSIVEQLMSLERRPIVRMEADKTWLNSRLASYTAFDAKLKGFLSSIDDLDSSTELRQKTTTVASEGHFTATAGADSLAGTNYQVEVVSLAQVQKSVTVGFADKNLDQFGEGDLTFTVGGMAKTVSIATGDGSLEGIMQAINDADIGVSAAIINDGTENPYRLVFTGADVATDFSIDVTGLTSGSMLAPVGNPISVTQSAAQAHIRVDNIDIYANSNTLSDAIPGVTLNLLQAELGTQTSMGISLDEQAIKSQIQSFVNGYNDAVSFVTNQSVIDGSSGGILAGDSGLSAVKRHMQDMLTTKTGSSDVLRYLTELGLKTQKDGTLILDDDKLTSAIQNNLDDVEGLLVGTDESPGIASQFKDYLVSLTSSVDGLLAGRSQSINSNLKRIDNRITQTEARLVHKEETMRAKFTTLESLISGMNSQSTFLTQQLDMLNNMMTRK